MHRFIIMRLGSLGDVVLTSPAPRALRAAFPSAHIAFLTSTPFAPLYASNPHVDEVLTVDRARTNRDVGAIASLARRIREGRYDVSIDLHRKLKTAGIARLARVRTRVGGSALDTVRVTLDGSGHASEHALAALAPLGISDDDTRPEVFVSGEDEAAAIRLLRDHGIDPTDDRILGIFPGAGWEPRAWMPERFAEVARRAIDEDGMRVVVVGAEKDRGATDNIAASLGNDAVVLMDLPLGVLAGVLKQCAKFVSNDTGPMHLSVAVGTPTVALFGPGNFERFAPRHAPHVGIREHIACSPCKQFSNHCRDNVCMQLITVDRVWSEVESLGAADAGGA
jgi:lipopolysaccharide heptosyltransferase II